MLMKVPGIELSNGHVLKYMIASGGLEYDGRGWFWDYPLRWLGLLDERLFTTVMKTVTFLPRKGNFRWYHPMRCISYLPNGVVNAFGLTNPGIHVLYEKIEPVIDKKKAAVVGSVLGEPEEKAEMIRFLNDVDLVAIEDNASCPNTETDILNNREKVIRGFEATKKASRFPIIGKLSVVHDIEWILERCEGLVEAISINSVPWAILNPFEKSPLARFGGGGVSGKAAQSQTWDLVRKIRDLTDIPAIGPSIWDYEDIDSLIKIGAKAVSFGSLLMPHPYHLLNPLKPTAFVCQHLRENP